jgi:hypothetical protein
LAVVLIAVGGWYIAGHRTKDASNATANSASSAEKGWATYKNQKYGLQFTYPASWGEPSFIETSAVHGQTGKVYVVTFSTRSADNNQTTESMQLYSQSTDGVSKDSIQKVLKQAAKDNLAAYDSSSYAFINKLQPENSSTLDAYQIIDITKSKMDAAVLSFTIAGNAKDCPEKGAFAKEPNQNCITKSDYNTVHTVLKSIKNL